MVFTNTFYLFEIYSRIEKAHEREGIGILNVSITVEHRFAQTPDNSVWTQAAFNYTFWQRYLDVFDAVNVIARVEICKNVPSDWIRADGINVKFHPLPYYIGPYQYMLRSQRIKQNIQGVAYSQQAIILRIPSQIAALTYSQLIRHQHPFGIEVVGDPYDIFAPGAIKHPLRRIFRWYYTKTQKQHCQQACAVAYVTAQTLQQRYPPGTEAFSIGCSDVELPDETFAVVPRVFQEPSASARLIMVGSLEQMYKAPDVLLHAVARCVERGLNLQLTVIGKGKHQQEMIALAESLGLSGRVQFLGQLPAGAAVRAQLDQADVFVLPSRTEGLPRAMIEAMARGLPCIGSTVGGIPELLPPEDMVPPNDAAALALKIEEVVCNPARMTQMSARNLEVARTYHESILRERRITFYRYLRDKTQVWMDQQ